MDTFDYVIVALGVALIIIGLLLFIAGKRESQSGNQVEGFGIKLNVSNPSIILIVFGIGMVLFPRLMPNNTAIVNLADTPQLKDSQTGNTQVAQNPNPQNTPAPAPASSNVFFPMGMWYLYQYEENGIDLSGTLEGSMQFSGVTGGQQNWSASLMTVDGWGNVINYQYAGLIQSVPGGYVIDTQRSNDPSFVPQGPSNLVLKMDNPQSLHMEYMFNGSQIILHLSQ
ncbi:hypothetical protein [Glaciecola sp. SC05]|uniref:hypothetical protein n=1 Tax=Glaciecola sp. SC05 TaxID=1987355 RepID=UPI003527797E